MLNLVWLLPLLLAGADSDEPSAGPVPGPDPTRPTLVALDFRNRPVPEVVAALAERSGNPITLRFHPQRGLDDHVTLEAPGPRPFWEAFDRLRRGAGLKRDLMWGRSLASNDRLSLVGPGEVVDDGPAHYVGPFRFGRFTLHRYHRHIYVPGPKQPYRVDPGPAYAEFEVLVEPRVLAVRIGPVEVIEAVDDRGRSLSDPEALAQVDGPKADRSLDDATQVRIPLALPEGPGGRLVCLRGVLPVEVGIRPEEPTLEIFLEGAIGRTFRAGELGITIREFTVADDGFARLSLTVQIKSSRGMADRVPENVLTERFRNIFDLQLELADARGRRVDGGGGWKIHDDGARAEFTARRSSDADAATDPTHLRVYAPEWVAWDAPFEFNDLPLP